MMGLSVELWDNKENALALLITTESMATLVLVGDALMSVADISNCWYCGKKLIPLSLMGKYCRWENGCYILPADCDRLIYDHVIPKSKGGSNSASNLVPCCNICNATKKDKNLEQYRAYREKKDGISPYLFWHEKRNGLENE